MPTSYTFDSALNLDKCFQNTPPPTLKIDNLFQHPENWLTELENKCRKIKPDLEKNIFYKHIGCSSKYKLKTELFDQLCFIHYRISDCSEQLDYDSNKILLNRLIEDIDQCTPGFHIRVNELVNSLQTPNTFEQLLYLVRKSIVQETVASSLMDLVDPIYQVHVADRVCRIAKKKGLGIEPNIQKDQYKSLLPGQTIRAGLKDEFPKHYMPLKIPSLLTEQLQLILSLYDYQGAKRDYYKSETAENLVSFIKNFFSATAIKEKHFKDFFILYLDQFEDPTLLFDLNWSLIRQLFFQKLINENYFIYESKPSNLLEYAYFQALAPEKIDRNLEALFVKQYINRRKEPELFDHLLFIQDQFLDYWKGLVTSQCIINLLDTLLFFANVMQNNNLNDKKLQKQLNLIYSLLFSKKNKFILDRIIFPSIKEITFKDINFELLIKSIKYRAEITKKCFNLVFNKKTNSQLLFEILSKQNTTGTTLLMSAARYHEETFKLIINIIRQSIHGVETEKILSVFLLQNNQGWNFLSLAGRYNPNSLENIFEFFKHNPKLFDFNIIKELFYKTNNFHQCFLQCLASYQNEVHVNLCLEFINKKFNTENKNWLSLIINEHLGMLLRLASQSNLNALGSFLKFIGRHRDQINSDILRDIFLRQSKNNWNCLHAAARYWPTNLSLMLQFFQDGSAKFTNSAIRDLFLALTLNQSNFLMLAAAYQPQTIPLLFEFIHQEAQVFDKKTLHNLFLQQNSEGWNLLSMSYLQPTNIKLILDFINAHPESFDAETIKKIILQKNKHDYTCLHYAARFQPDSLEVILDFIDQRFALFANELKLLFENSSQFQLITTLFRKPTSKSINLLAFSLKHQQESAAQFSNFLIAHANTFNLKKTYLKDFTDQNVGMTLLTDDYLHSATPRAQ